MNSSTSEKALIDRLKGVPLFSSTSARQRKSLAKLGKVDFAALPSRDN